MSLTQVIITIGIVDMLCYALSPYVVAKKYRWLPFSGLYAAFKSLNTKENS